MHPRRSALALFAVVIGLASARADTGTITGVVDRPAGVTGIVAIDRSEETDKKYKGKIDPRTGRFTISGLPLKATYDVVIDMGAVRLEGVNLKVKPSDFEEEMPLTKEDIATITKISKDLNKFENEVDVMTVTGNCQ